jgi:hypothetical protein
MAKKDKILHEFISSKNSEDRLIIRKSHAPGQIEYNGDLIDFGHNFNEKLKNDAIRKMEEAGTDSAMAGAEDLKS